MKQFDSIRILTFGDLEVVGRIRDASNASLFAKSHLEDKEVQCIYKPIIGERPLWDFAEGNLASREVASYRISEWGNWNLIPPTILRDGPFGLGAVQLWIEIDHAVDLETFFRSDDIQLRNLALLDAVLNNTDRKIGHLLVDKSGRLYACDHGVTLHAEDKLRTVLWQFAGKPLNQSELNQLIQLKERIKENLIELQELITSSEISALMARIEKIENEKLFPFPSEDWPAIPWPPF